MDRKRTDEKKTLKPKPKFVDLFLQDAEGYDVWRHLFPSQPGFTYRNDTRTSLSRIDYFLLSSKLSSQRGLNMTIGNWEKKKDHCLISLEFSLVGICQRELEKAWSIPQPELRNLTPAMKLQCKELLESNLNIMSEEVSTLSHQCSFSVERADNLSVTLAEILVQTIGSVSGMKRGTHKKGRFESLEFNKVRAEIGTIKKARDLIRSLFLDEVLSSLDRRHREEHLKVCLDRLVRLGLNSVPTSLDINLLFRWSESSALADIENLTGYIKSRKEDLLSQEKTSRQDLFLDPKMRGKWLERVFGGRAASCPRSVVDSTSGLRIPKKSNESTLKKGLHF